MGKLTDSLKATTQQLSQIKQGIEQMQALGHELADNTLTVAETALRTGYAYAQAEAAVAQADPQDIHPALPAAPTVLDADQLGQATRWNEKSLKARFGKFQAAYQYLKQAYGISPKARSWQAVVQAFNQAGHDRNSSDRIVQLEQIIALQNQRITALEEKLDYILQQLEQLKSSSSD